MFVFFVVVVVVVVVFCCCFVLLLLSFFFSFFFFLFFKDPKRHFCRFNKTNYILNGFGSALGKFASFCRYNAQNSNLSRTLDDVKQSKKSVLLQGFKETGLGHLFFFLSSNSVKSVRPIM